MMSEALMRVRNFGLVTYWKMAGNYFGIFQVVSTKTKTPCAHEGSRRHYA